MPGMRVPLGTIKFPALGPKTTLLSSSAFSTYFSISVIDSINGGFPVGYARIGVATFFLVIDSQAQRCDIVRQGNIAHQVNGMVVFAIFRIGIGHIDCRISLVEFRLVGDEAHSTWHRLRPDDLRFRKLT